MTKYLRKVKQFFRLDNIAFLLCLAFLIWFYAFRGFLLDKLTLTSDAMAYYDHFKFFADALKRGVYPLWDPTFEHGIPVEFFLRRIGSFNPLILFPFLLNKLGIPHVLSYLFFLGFYYFLGMIGFYLIAKKIFKNPAVAFVACLLLMFSSLGTRLFDSYILLTFIPMVWFFYFCVSFFDRPQRFYFIGMIFTLMILFVTYIPFYFITILGAFLILFGIFYFSHLASVINRVKEFFKGNRIFGALCLLAFLISLWPGYAFYKETKAGGPDATLGDNTAEFILPERHATSTSDSQIGVGISTSTSWGIEEDLAYSQHFRDYKEIGFAVVYIPIYAFILFWIGAFATTQRNFFLLFGWGCLLLFMTTPRITGLYEFLYDHVFYFKYFRNLHFFLWLILLPLFILVLAQQLKSFLNFKPQRQAQRHGLLAFLAVIHIGFAILAYLQGQNIVSTYAVIGLSFGVLVAHVYGWLNPRYLPALFLLLVVTQPLEVYHYLSKNAVIKEYKYRYDEPNYYLSLGAQYNDKDLFKVQAENKDLVGNIDQVVDKKSTRSYINVKWKSFLEENLNSTVYGNYMLCKALLYDHVEWIDDDHMDLERIGKAFQKLENTVFVSVGKGEHPQEEGAIKSGSKPEILTKDSKNLQILESDFNHFKIKVRSDRPKFLVYNDSYHSEWQVFVNGQKMPLYRANIAFKGVWVPAGESVVYFRYGSPTRYFRNYLLLAVFYSMFIYLLLLWYQFYRKKSGVIHPHEV